ncbi:hypothetical protein SEA_BENTHERDUNTHAT_82 [Gordonia phage BENtherdunthat]|uniref:Uncharacterized protein n=1 Tax=Gordonia phage BENtherdunthat TaxID=2047830 RepID=A0A2H4PF33_9CAUD|nr:hypothetical protein HOS44_gp082 [Gordonia phage BENtherdunthat]ATW60852.1 hypothetical protein SEA_BENTHERDUNTHAT_82 [Gordonia phage BENtherdunthat]
MSITDEARTLLAHWDEYGITSTDADEIVPDLVKGLLAELLAEHDQLQRWKDEALPVIAGLQELGRALEVPLGRSSTGPEGAVKAQALRAERDAALATIRQVREWAAGERECYYTLEVRRILGDES